MLLIYISAFRNFRHAAIYMITSGDITTLSSEGEILLYVQYYWVANELCGIMKEITSVENDPP
jgi:hypothetical protein